MRGFIRGHPAIFIVAGLVIAAGAGVAGTILLADGDDDDSAAVVTETLDAPDETPEIEPDPEPEAEVAGPPDCSEFTPEDEGRCQSDGDLYVVVNRNSTLRLPEISVRMLETETAEVLEDLGDVSRAKGVFLIFTIEVTNRLDIPVEFDESGQIFYTAGEEDPQSVYTADSFPDWERSLLSKDPIQPGLSQTGTVVFDVPRRAAVRDLGFNGNLRSSTSATRTGNGHAFRWASSGRTRTEHDFLRGRRGTAG